MKNKLNSLYVAQLWH